MFFRSAAWKGQPKRFFSAHHPKTGEVRALVLTNGGVLKFQGRDRAYEYALGRWEDPIETIMAVWGFDEVTEVRR